MGDAALKNGADRDVWLRCFQSALTGLLSGNQTTYEPEQLIRQAGKLADIALTKVQVRHPLDDVAAGARAGQSAAAERAVQAAARERHLGDGIDPAEAGQPQAQTRSTAFPFYASDFLASTGLLSNAAAGAYIRMLAHAWSNGPIPDQAKALARAMNHSVGDPPFEELWAELKPKWFLTKRGWINCRLELVRWERAVFLERLQAKPAAAKPDPAPAATPAPVKDTRPELRIPTAAAAAAAGAASSRSR